MSLFFLMSENNNQQRQKWTSAKREAYKRRMEKLQEKRTEKGEITVKEFPFSSVDEPEMDENGNLVIPIHLETTKEEPVALYGCEEYLSQQGPHCWRGKNIDEIEEDLLNKQNRNERNKGHVDEEENN